MYLKKDKVFFRFLNKEISKGRFIFENYERFSREWVLGDGIFY